MKILILVDAFPKLTQTFVLDQVIELNKLGHNVTVLARHSVGDMQHVEASADWFLQHMQHWKISGPWAIYKKWKILLQASCAGWARQVLKNDISHAFKKPLRQFWLGDALRKHSNVDVISCHFGPVGLQAALLRVAGVFNAPIVTTFHGMSNYNNPHKAKKYLPLFNQGDGFVAVCNYHKKCLISAGCPESRIAVNPMGINFDFFQRQPRHRPLEKNENSFIRLVSVGRLEPVKGFENLIHAMRIVADSHPNVMLSIIGDGSQRANYLNLIEEENLTEHIKLIGAQTRNEIRAMLQKSHIYIQPSISFDYSAEAIPVALKEGGAAGNALIGSKHGGIPELIRNNETGLLVNEGSVNELAAAIIGLIDDEPNRLRLAHEAYDFVSQNYDNKKVVCDYVKILQSFITE
jgi:colanic acid/amylovoran biosynthesis glycosyltransferase